MPALLQHVDTWCFPIYLLRPYGYGSIPIHTIFRGWASIYQLFWCSPGLGFWPIPIFLDKWTTTELPSHQVYHLAAWGAQSQVHAESTHAISISKCGHPKNCQILICSTIGKTMVGKTWEKHGQKSVVGSPDLSPPKRPLSVWHKHDEFFLLRDKLPRQVGCAAGLEL